MSLALCALSHTPVMGVHQPADEVVARVEAALDDARAFVADVDPDLVVVFAPDHYNGFLYDLMPSFCIGAQATAVGDYGTSAGPLPVDRAAARSLASAVLDAGVDVAFSERMTVDHGCAQPLDLLFGGIDTVPVVPVFINCVAEPLGPVSRVRLLGEAVGRAAAALDRRVLLLGSGGLSHDPPVPRLTEAPPEVVERLISGRNPTPEERAARQARVFDAALAYAAGTSDLRPLNPEWDRRFLEVLDGGDLAQLDSWSNESFVQEAGHSSHEVRTWIAVHAALGAMGPYEVRSTFYEAIPEWIAGFGVTTARTRGR
ncbi:MAG: mhpB [Modestobacter sp.]|jgi:2,3-dihydroxyphenylpropionate 1,2-dioxygenase|nr:mhpB [Modestobacter sp.]